MATQFFDFTREFDGVDEAVQQQQGAVYNEPDPFVIPSSSSTASTVEFDNINNGVPTGSLNPYSEAIGADDPDGAQAVYVNLGVTGDEDFENAQAVALNTPFSPTPTNSQPYKVDVVGVAPAQQPLVNPLHDYDSYTYNISLHALTVEQFNNLNDNPDGYQPLNVLIAGAGKYSSNFRRNAYFQEDFYFDDLRLDSVINTKKTNQFSNVVNIEFTIIEPNGFTLIQRLLSACEAPVEQGGVGGQNYLKQPFILQVDFYGSQNGEIGAGIIPNQSKLIPIRLIGMNTSVGVKGTTYRIEAVPYNHKAFDPTQINTPANFSIKAATVADIFGGGEVTTANNTETQRYLDQVESRQQFTNAIGNLDPEQAEAVARLDGFSIPQITQELGTNGLAAAYNSYYSVLEQRSSLKENRIKFNIDPDLSKSQIYTVGPNDVSNAATTGNERTEAQIAGGSDRGTIKFNTGTLFIPAGTNIQSVVNWALINSEYMRSQVVGIVGAGAGSVQQTAQPLKIVKIIPRIRIIDYDYQRNDYRYEITYFIKKYFANSRTAHAPQGRISGWVKEYNYIYTGGQSPYTGDNASNKDVINLDIDFNMLFFTTLTAFKEKKKQFNTGKSQVTDRPDIANQEARPPTDNSTNVSTSGELNPAQILEDRVARTTRYYTAGNYKNQTRTGAGQAGVQAAADILFNQLLDARGDMINVRLTIVGDPQFIKQDDLLYKPNLTGETGLLTPNNSLFTDEGELYVYINFRSPVDYDESTGLAIPRGNNFSYSLFTGVYKVITVESRFRMGQFTQVLDLVRLPISDENRLKEAQVAYRSAYGFEIGSGQNTAFPYGQNVGQRIIGTLFSGGLLNGGSGLESVANQIVQQTLGKAQSTVVKEVGRLTSDIFGSSDSLSGVDLNTVFDPEVGDPSLFNTIADIDLPALNELSDAFGSLDTNVINNVDLFDLDFNASVPDTLPDIDYLGNWL